MNKVATLYDIVFYAVGGCCISDVSLVESETSIVFVHFVFALFNEVCEVVFIHHLLQYRQSHHILLEYITAVDIRDPNQQKVEFIDEVKGGPDSGETY